jgi:hypothetical protein
MEEIWIGSGTQLGQWTSNRYGESGFIKKILFQIRRIHNTKKQELNFWQNLVKLSLYYLIVVVGPGERLETVRVEAPAGGVQLLPVVLGQLRPERVDRDDKCPAIHTSQC